MFDAFRILGQVLLVVILTDFVAGLVHWIEDAYIRIDTPFLGQSVGKANTIHHHYPRFFTHLSYLDSSWDLIVASSVLVIGTWFLGILSWQVWLFALIASNANEIHKMTHRTKAENGPVITFFQKIYILQTPRHHALHHTNPKNVRYCPVTNFLNPLLDFTSFWRGLEWGLEHVFKLKRREDTSVLGSVPRWVKDHSSRPK